MINYSKPNTIHSQGNRHIMNFSKRRLHCNNINIAGLKAAVELSTSVIISFGVFSVHLEIQKRKLL